MTHTYNPIPIAQAYAAMKGDISARCVSADPNVETGVNAQGKPWRRRNVVLADESGSVTAACWDKWVDVVQPGGTYAIANPQWKDWHGSRIVGLSMYCQVQRTDGVQGEPEPSPPPPEAATTPQGLGPPMGQVAAAAAAPPPPPPPPPPAPQAEPEAPAPPEGPGDKNVIERVRLIHYFERDIRHELYTLDDGAYPSPARVGMYLKIIHDDFVRKAWRKPRNGKTAKPAPPTQEDEQA